MSCELHLRRIVFEREYTIGLLSLDGRHECFTLEDQVRSQGAPKVQGETAIPEGRYRVILTYSQKFGGILPLLVAVPNFTGIRIHAGTTDDDTSGCILVGREVTKRGELRESRVALQALKKKLQKQISERGEQIWITVDSLDRQPGCLRVLPLPSRSAA